MFSLKESERIQVNSERSAAFPIDGQSLLARDLPLLIQILKFQGLQTESVKLIRERNRTGPYEYLKQISSSLGPFL